MTSWLEIETAALADAVGVVGVRGVGDGSGGAAVGVAEVVGEVLDLFGAELHVVADDHVVRGFGGALGDVVGLQVEVEVVRVGDAGVHDGAWRAVEVLTIRLGRLNGVRSGVVALDDDEGGDQDFLRMIWKLLLAKSVPSSLDASHFVVQDLVEVAVADAIAVVEDALW
ncbi:hypothetical protein M409DRAFT_60402 [Zasmidium cellare ATCC 36951]|uniref:Uncharacterized protein n=1 Tax=Zasmidium cellare ATCC 36951 TaxID=1080233 RepID=A0A6A6BYY7_ZASCE|nr:uncharacterized protein M409DRAFT_60402 [Zasmidium cellare ATCC 36951]KAF2160001.1 hypothetical protein M409DRAFT_60402 [Zasmidium cellare ATCC 36951]